MIVNSKWKYAHHLYNPIFILCIYTGICSGKFLACFGGGGVRDQNGCIWKYEIEVPDFSKHLKSFNNKTIRLKGYIIPLAELGGQSEFMLSSLPFSMCYFCGSAGPETVIEIESKEKIKFTTRQVMMQGTLVLNATDPDHHMYILKSAKLIQD